MKLSSEVERNSLKECLINVTKNYLAISNSLHRFDICRLFYGDSGRRRAANFLQILEKIELKSDIDFCIVLQSLLSTSSKQLVLSIAETLIDGKFEIVKGYLGNHCENTLCSMYFSGNDFNEAVKDNKNFYFYFALGLEVEYVCKIKLLSFLIDKELSSYSECFSISIKQRVLQCKRLLESSNLIVDEVYSVFPGGFYSRVKNSCYEPDENAEEYTFTDMGLG